MNKIFSLLKSNLVKNSIWLFILQFANLVLPLLTIPYITRILGAAGYGEYSIAYNWMTYFQVLVEYGFALGGARKIAISKSVEEEQKIFDNILFSRMLLFLISFVIVNIICVFSGASSSQYRNVMILMLVVLSVVFQANWIFQGKQQMKFITIVNVIGRVVSVLLVFIFVKSSDQVWLYCLLYSVTFIFSSSVGMLIAIKRFHFRLHIVPIKNVFNELKENFPLFASAAISRLFGNVGITVLGIFAVDSVVGGYSAIYKIPYIMTLFYSPIGQALYPFISKKYKFNEDEARRQLKKIAIFVLGVFSLCGIVIISIKDIIVLGFLGEEYVRYSSLIVFLIPQTIFGILNNFLGIQTLVAYGKQSIYTICILIGAASLVLINFILCPVIGATGTAVAALSSEMLLTGALVFCCNKYIWRKKFDV